MVGCFGTNFLSSATYMGEKPLLLHDTYVSKENTKVYNRYQSYFLVFNLVSCFQVIEFDPHYVNYKCIHLIK